MLVMMFIFLYSILVMVRKFMCTCWLYGCFMGKYWVWIVDVYVRVCRVVIERWSTVACMRC